MDIMSVNAVLHLIQLKILLFKLICWTIQIILINKLVLGLVNCVSVIYQHQLYKNISVGIHQRLSALGQYYHLENIEDKHLYIRNSNSRFCSFFFAPIGITKYSTLFVLKIILPLPLIGVSLLNKKKDKQRKLKHTNWCRY